MKKKFILILFSFFVFVNTFAQSKNSGSTLVISSIVPDFSVKEFPYVKSILEDKLLNIVSSSGIGGYSGSRFFIAPKISVTEKKKIPGPGGAILFKANLTLIIADNTDQKVINTYSSPISGIGYTDFESVSEALKSLNPDDEKLKRFMIDSRSRIIDYYNSNCNSIIQFAEANSSNQPDDVLYNLSLIPIQNSDCYEKEMRLTKLIIQNQIATKCSNAISKARLAWSKGNNEYSANEAFKILNSIEMNNQCAVDASALAQEISSVFQTYEKNRLEIDKKKIESENLQYKLTSDIIIEYFRNQPKEIYNTEFIFLY